MFCSTYLTGFFTHLVHEEEHKMTSHSPALTTISICYGVPNVTTAFTLKPSFYADLTDQNISVDKHCIDDTILDTEVKSVHFGHSKDNTESCIVKTIIIIINTVHRPVISKKGGTLEWLCTAKQYVLIIQSRRKTKPSIVIQDDARWSSSPLAYANNGTHYEMTHALFKLMQL